MNDMQKSQIINMRAEGIGYVKIAKRMGLSENTVKSFCRRNNLTKSEATHPLPTLNNVSAEHFCLQCGKLVEQNDKRKLKKFCSDKCRMAWWNSNRDKVKHKKSTMLECQNCHKYFMVYGNSIRKYCSHACYITDRFGGVCDE